MPQAIAPPISDAKNSTTNESQHDPMSASLGTFLARIQFDNFTVSAPIRGFCDTGAQVNLITESCVQAMHLRREKTRVPIDGLGSTTVAAGIVNLTLTHRNDVNVQIQISAFVVSHIIANLPNSRMDSPFDNEIPTDQLADPAYKVPAGIDILLGAGAWAAIVTDKMHRICSNGHYAIAQLTAFGWVIYGHMFPYKNDCARICQATIDVEDARIDQLLIKYWNADSIPKARQWTADEQRAEDIFVTTHRRESNGRYTVQIPFVQDKKPLGDSAKTAKAIFLGVERRLHRDPLLFAQYKAVFDDYRSLRHMVLAPERPIDPAESYYIPHHAINIAEKKKKFRVVFNASAATTTGVSLNDQQLAGPRLQDDLNTIFLRFRSQQYGMTADIKQMFRQVNVSPEHWNYQRVYYRDSPSEPLQEYVTTVICWGQTSAGFNAVRAVQQCAIDGQTEFPIGSYVALNDLYYDDILTGAKSEEELLTVYEQSSRLLMTGGFELAKWATNSKTLATAVADGLRQDCELPIDAGVLGMRWHTATDTLRIDFTDEINIPDAQLTKRRVISATSLIYDPTGLVLPVIVIGKILQRDIWLSGINWDQLLKPPSIAKWHEYRHAITQLSRISIPRWLGMSTGSSIQLHIFTDASEKAMGAAAYFRITRSDNTTAVALITARSKIAPVKRATIPRLELMAALIGAELSQFIRTAFRMPNIEATFWTDSTIVVHWLRRDPNCCKPFIANRIVSIREASENGIWRHVQGTDNPADLLTRGASAEQLMNASLWWNGPGWLAGSTNDWPKSHVTTLTPELQAILDAEDKNIPDTAATETHRSKKGRFVCIVVNKATTPLSVYDADDKPTPITSRRSELSSLLRVTSYAFRFVYNALERAKRRKITKEIRAPPRPVEACDRNMIPAITNVERQRSLRYWIADAQRTYYFGELNALRANRAVPRSSPIIKLRPYIDTNGFLRVGGRMANANIAEEAKHQLLLPPQARITQLIIRDAHFVTIHGGPQLMLAHLHRSYWMTRARQIVKSAIHNCPICERYDQPENTQLMGNLPTDRVTQAECFLHTGLDFAGPFVIKKQRGRPPNIEKCSKNPVTSTLKAWIVIFVCLSTKAVHIDVLLGLTIEEFLAAFERFTMRKGRCTKLISDNGTTFIGSDKELARVLQSWSKVLPEHNLSRFGTDWQFITPSAPFKGGLWESAVKSMKRHMKRAIGVRTLTKDELYQLAVHIEGCLNSRPLWPMSDDPTDPMPLTPAHFVLGKAILPQPVAEDVAESPENRLTIWGQRQKLQQQIWRRWHDEYLCTKQVRTKWYNIEKNLKIGDMVVVRKENTPPAMWIIGRIIKTFAGGDGMVRSAIVKTPTGELERPVNKLVFLPQPQPISVDHPINGGDC